MNEQTLIPIKIIMLGSINVGKTSLVTKYATGKIPGKTKTTESASYVSKLRSINGNNFEIKIWDTAGQEKFKSITKIFTKESKIAILVYSIDNEESFNDLDGWLKLIKESNDKEVILGVAANKSDLKSDSTISESKGREYAEKIGAEWKSTSAILENGGIEEFVETLFLKYYSTIFITYNNNYLDDALSHITLSTLNSRAKKGKCCK